MVYWALAAEAAPALAIASSPAVTIPTPALVMDLSMATHPPSNRSFPSSVRSSEAKHPGDAIC